jgi:hypothetical protein
LLLPLLLLLLQNEPMIFSPAPNCTPDHMAVLHSLSSTKIALLVELPAHDLVLCPEAALTGGAAVIIGVLRARQGLPAAAAAAAEGVRHAGSSAAAEEKQAEAKGDKQQQDQQQAVAAVQPAAAVGGTAAAAAVMVPAVDAPETPAAEDAAAAAAAGPQAQVV